MRVIST